MYIASYFFVDVFCINPFFPYLAFILNPQNVKNPRYQIGHDIRIHKILRYSIHYIIWYRFCLLAVSSIMSFFFWMELLMRWIPLLQITWKLNSGKSLESILRKDFEVSGKSLLFIIIWLVVEPPKNMKVNCDDDIHNIWKNKTTCSSHQPVIYLSWHPKSYRFSK